MLQTEYDELKKKIEAKLESWDESKKIFKVVSDLNLLDGYPTSGNEIYVAYLKALTEAAKGN